MTDATNEALRILIEERDRINQAIELLQGQTGAAPKRRGRPPGSGKKATKKSAKRGRRREMTAAEKRAVSERMKKYWAARRKGKK